MIDKQLLNILCCPETKQDVSLIQEKTVNIINKKIKEGSLYNRGGDQVTEKIDSGLLREDNKYLYPVRNDIPIMLIDEAIPFEEFANR